MPTLAKKREKVAHIGRLTFLRRNCLSSVNGETSSVLNQGNGKALSRSNEACESEPEHLFDPVAQFHRIWTGHGYTRILKAQYGSHNRNTIMQLNHRCRSFHAWWSNLSKLYPSEMKHGWGVFVEHTKTAASAMLPSSLTTLKRTLGCPWYG